MPRSRSLAELVQQNRSADPVLAAAADAISGSESKPSGVSSGTVASGGVSDEVVAGAIQGATAAKAAGTSMAAGAVKGAGAASKGAGLLTLFCWVAAEYYPRDSVDWHRCRNWVLGHPRLTHYYAEHGERFAGFLNRHPLAHWLFRPIVEYAHRKGRL